MLKRFVAPVFVAFLGLGVAACGSKGDCEKAVDHMIKLTEQELPEDKRAQAAGDRTKLIEQCKKDGLSKKQEECILGASELAKLSGCDAN